MNASVVEAFNIGFRQGANAREADGLRLSDPERKFKGQLPECPPTTASDVMKRAWTRGFILGYEIGASDGEIARSASPGADGLVSGFSAEMMDLMGISHSILDN